MTSNPRSIALVRSSQAIPSPNQVVRQPEQPDATADPAELTGTRDVLRF